jgi:hypothetical protein
MTKEEYRNVERNNEAAAFGRIVTPKKPKAKEEVVESTEPVVEIEVEPTVDVEEEVVVEEKPKRASRKSKKD